jgi:hypothetical protein
MIGAGGGISELQELEEIYRSYRKWIGAKIE